MMNCRLTRGQAQCNRLAIAAAGLFCVCIGRKGPQACQQEEAASRGSPILGKVAPDFTLSDQHHNLVTLSQLAGQWVVLCFYAQDDTPGCTCQATEFTELLSLLRQMNACVYGISGQSVGSHEAFIYAYDLGLDLLSGTGHGVMEQHGAWGDARLGDKRNGRVIGTTMIIDSTGIIRYHWPKLVSAGHAQRVRYKLADRQAQVTFKAPS